MYADNWVSWGARGILAVLAVVAMIGFLRWMRESKGGWGEFWGTLQSTLRKQVAGLLLVATAWMLVTLLWPMARLEQEVTQAVIRMLSVVWIVLLAWGGTLALSVATSAVQWKYDVNVEDNLKARRVHTRMRVLQRIVVVIIWLGAVAAILMQFERFRALGTTLLASAGIFSIVLGISAQKTFSSMIAGLQIALSHPINLDDVVIVEDEWGRIEEIAFTYVVVRLWDQRRLIVPVTYFLEKPFQNWTRKSSDIIGSVFLYVDYETPLEPLRQEARRLCEAAGNLWDGKTCLLQVTDTSPEAMTIRVIASSPDAPKAWDLRCLLREGLIEFVRAHSPQSLPRRRVSLAQDGTVSGLREP